MVAPWSITGRSTCLTNSVCFTCRQLSLITSRCHLLHSVPHRILFRVELRGSCLFLNPSIHDRMQLLKPYRLGKQLLIISSLSITIPLLYPFLLHMGHLVQLIQRLSEHDRQIPVMLHDNYPITCMKGVLEAIPFMYENPHKSQPNITMRSFVVVCH